LLVLGRRQRAVLPRARLITVRLSHSRPQTTLPTRPLPALSQRATRVVGPLFASRHKSKQNPLHWTVRCCCLFVWLVGWLVVFLFVCLFVCFFVRSCAELVFSVFFFASSIDACACRV